MKRMFGTIFILFVSMWKAEYIARAMEGEHTKLFLLSSGPYLFSNLSRLTLICKFTSQFFLSQQSKRLLGGGTPLTGTQKQFVSSLCAHRLIYVIILFYYSYGVFSGLVAYVLKLSLANPSSDNNICCLETFFGIVNNR